MTHRTTRVLALAVVLLLGIMLAGTAAADHIPNPASVTLGGELQSAASGRACGDWDSACAATHLASDAEAEVWQGTFPIPAGTFLYQYAIT